MGFKVKHYAAKTVPANSSLEWELKPIRNNT